MGLLTNVINRLIGRNEAAAAPAAPRRILMPESDAIETRNLRKSYATDGTSFQIEYIDANGQGSTRRITVRGFKKSADGSPMLVAMCHERQAQRQFIVNRIQCCIDYDGVVHDDVAAFLSDTLGSDFSRAMRRSSRGKHSNQGTQLPTRSTLPVQRTPAKVSWEKKRETIRPHALILTALALADGQLHEAEFELILAHCSRLAAARRKMLADDDDKARRYILRLRPSAKNIEDACETIRHYNEKERFALYDTAIKLASVDGRRDEVETAFLQDLARELNIKYAI